MTEPHLLVDARSTTHVTAGGRGIGNYTLGLLEGFQAVGARFTALVERPEDVGALAGIDASSVEVLGRDVVRRSVTDATWFVATGLFLHPVSFDPIPRMISESGVPVAGIMYDVIPYRDPDRYLTNDDAVRQARLRAVLARTVDATLAISRFSAQTACDVLGLDADRVRVIGAGVAAAFRPGDGDGPNTSDVVAVTGADPRKNTDGLLRAWARVRPPTRAAHRLVVVASAPAAQLTRWRDLAARLGCGNTVDVRGAVEQPEMVALLQGAWLVVQPSLDEGFGLPVVEAAACGAPVICSSTSALGEVLDDASATFVPDDPDDLARALERGCDDEAHREVLLTTATRAAARWTWSRVATELLAALAELEPVRMPRRPLARRIALVTPPGPAEQVATDVAMVSQELDLAFFVDDPAGRPGRRSPGDADPTTPDDLGVPAGGLGRYVKLHEFDEVVTVHGDLDGPAPAATRVARRVPTHVWLWGSEVDGSVLERARSVIVGSVTASDEVRRVRPDVPVLVLPRPEDRWSPALCATALAAWLSHGPPPGAAVTLADPEGLARG